MTLPPTVRIGCSWLSAALAVAAAAHGQTAVSDNYDGRVDIDEKHIVESPFERSIRVDLDAAQLKLLVGVGANADRADITLRGVHGEAHFRASLDDIRQRLFARQPR